MLTELRVIQAQFLLPQVNAGGRGLGLGPSQARTECHGRLEQPLLTLTHTHTQCESNTYSGNSHRVPKGQLKCDELTSCLHGQRPSLPANMCQVQSWQFVRDHLVTVLPFCSTEHKQCALQTYLTSTEAWWHAGTHPPPT